MKRIKYLAAVLVLVAAVLLEPVRYAKADGVDRTDDVPRLVDFTVEFETEEGIFWNGWLDFETREFITGVNLRHKKLDSLDYSQYYLECNITLATMCDDEGDGKRIEYTDLYDSISLTDFNYGLFYDVSTYLDLVDGYFDHFFDYDQIVREAEHGFKAVQLNKYGEKKYTYNTVISSMDFYFVRMSDGECGKALCCEFYWDDDFYAQECVGVSYYWHDVEDDGEPEDYEEPEEDDRTAVDVEDDDWYDIPSLLDEFKFFLLGLPEAFKTIVVGVITFSIALVNLIKVLFPYIPGVIWGAFRGLLVLSISVSIYKFVFRK